MGGLESIGWTYNGPVGVALVVVFVVVVAVVVVVVVVIGSVVVELSLLLVATLLAVAVVAEELTLAEVLSGEDKLPAVDKLWLDAVLEVDGVLDWDNLTVLGLPIELPRMLEELLWLLVKLERTVLVAVLRLPLIFTEVLTLPLIFDTLVEVLELRTNGSIVVDVVDAARGLAEVEEVIAVLILAEI